MLISRDAGSGLGTLILALALTSLSAHAKEVSEFRTGGNVDLADAPDGASVTTMGGHIRLRHVERFARLTTYGGNIEIGSATGSARLTTYSGNIDIASATGSVTATTMAGNINVRVLSDTRPDGQRNTITLTSNSGEVSLFLPQGFGATIDIELAHTVNQPKDFRIVDNLGLKQTPRSGSPWDFWRGTPRNYIIASGVVGDGATHIVIHTVNGNVTVQRAAEPAQGAKQPRKDSEAPGGKDGASIRA
jgi:DUF4097 and DUF4098 domain-containing protein YvlB